MQVIVDRIEEDMVVLHVLPHRAEAILISTTLIPHLAEGDQLEISVRRAGTAAPVVRPDPTRFLRELRKKL